MQKRSRRLEIKFEPIPLDPALPICGGDPYFQSDNPITFLHVHDCLELGYCFSGDGVFFVGEKVLPFRAGDMVFINHTEVHLARSAPGTGSEWSWVYCDPIRLVGHRCDNVSDLDPSPFAGPDFLNVLCPTTHSAHGRIVQRMVEELRARTQGRDSVLRALTWELMMLMQRAGRPKMGNSAKARLEYTRLAPALQMLATDYALPLRSPDVARRCGLSEPHFRRLFLRTIGRSPRSYWNNLRLNMAASLLRGTTRSVLEISQDVGFETLSSFNRLFLSHFGASPRAWRNDVENSAAASRKEPFFLNGD